MKRWIKTCDVINAIPCIDTAHLYCSGLIDSPEMMLAFIKKVAKKRDVIFHMNDQTHPFASGKDLHTAPFSGRLFTKAKLFESLELLFYIVTSKYVSVFEFGVDYIKARDVSLAFRHRIGNV